MKNNLTAFLNSKVDFYNQPSFIKNDPICIPHLFTKKQDIEIAGFFAAIFAWGNRTTIINKSKELMRLMDNAPHDFCMNHTDNDLKTLLAFRHRTFNATDLLYFIAFFNMHYGKHNSLEIAFTKWINKKDETVEAGLNGFYQYFFSLADIPQRTRKHIASPKKNSSCKRLNMFLRWMVRKDSNGVDFGIWENINPSQLICPLDVHVARVAKELNILKRLPTDWKAALELTAYLRTLDKTDPVKYDFALFGSGVMEQKISQMDNNELILILNNELAIDFPLEMTYSQLHGRLATYINELIKFDFEKLIAYLYRIDVHENKLKTMLLDNPQDDAGNIIATLIIERQQQKIKTRQQFSQRDDDFNEEEKW